MKKINLKITGKMLAINGCLLALFSASFIYLSIAIGQGTSIIQTQQQTLTNLEMANSAFGSFSAVRYWLSDLAVSWLTDSEEKADQARQRLDSLLVQLEDEAELAQGLREQVNQYYDISINAVDAYVDENRVLGNSLTAEARRHADAIQNQINDLLLTTETKAKEAGKTVIASNQKNRAAALVLMLIVTVIGGTVSWFFSRSITRPLIRMSTLASRIAKGDIEQNIDYQSGDEIGRLADSFRSMIAAIKAKVEVAREISKGVVEIEIEKASDADALGQAMIEMKDLLKSRAEAAHKIAEGDLETKIEVTSADDMLGNAMVVMVENLARSQREVDSAMTEVEGNLKAAQVVVAEVNRVSALLEDGKLDERAHVDNAEGAYLHLISGVNKSIDSILEPVKEAIQVLQKMADGDLSASVTGNYKGGHALMQTSMNATLSSLNGLLGQVSAIVNQVSTGSEQVAQSSHFLSNGATNQASSLEQVTASMSEIGSQTKLNADNALEASELSNAARHNAQKGNKQMKKMLTAMGEIKGASDRINKIIKAIDEIAFQTNLLALNAAVEAARAGVHGKGFAVVAEEVRNLAQRSAAAANETTQLIEDSVMKVENGTKLANVTAKALDEIVAGVSKVTDLIEEIASASKEQALGIEQVNSGLVQIDQVTHANTANAEESASASIALSEQATELMHLLSKFKLQNSFSARNSKNAPCTPVMVVDETSSK